jgi:hypothetical protein
VSTFAWALGRFAGRRRVRQRCAEPDRRPRFAVAWALASLAGQALSGGNGQIKPREPGRPRRNATTLRGAGSPAAPPAARLLARLAGKAASAATGRSNRENRGARPDATTLHGGGVAGNASSCLGLTRLAGRAASAAKGRSNRENRGARNPMRRRCADQPVSPFRRVDEFRYHPPGGASWASANRRSFLKKRRARHSLELGCEGNSPPNQAVGIKTGFPRRRQA